MTKRFFFNSSIILGVFINIQSGYNQTVSILTSGTKTSMRGLSVIDDKTIWASGSNGMIARSTNGGNTFNWMRVPNFEKRDFRDIEAFDSNTAVIIAIAEPAQILKTINGGKSWKTVFIDSTKGMFLDAMSFANKNDGVVIGDPINNKTFLATTVDGGDTWVKQYTTPILAEGEAFFASSGSNISMQKNSLYFVSGGKKSNLYFDNKKFEIPITQGFESTGANSIAINNNKAIVVGGDFAKDTNATNNCVLINLKTMQFFQPKTSPTGYRSSVVFIDKNKVITCGLNGVDMSYDAGINWKKISNEGFHIVAKSKKGNSIFLAGSKGRIAKLNY